VTLRAHPHTVAVTITRRGDEFEAEEDREDFDRPASNEKKNTKEMHNENKQTRTSDKKKREEGKRTTTQLELGTSLRRRRVPPCTKRGGRYSLEK
jgi:hypothetical protein